MLFKPQTPLTSTQAITGRNIAHSPRGATQRAVLAAELVLGERLLVDPTILQSAAVCRVCRPYVQAVLKADAGLRAELVAGTAEIGELLRPAGERELAQAWHAASPRERAAFGAHVGIDELWDDAIAPALC
jgi:hypothetical protein